MIASLLQTDANRPQEPEIASVDKREISDDLDADAFINADLARSASRHKLVSHIRDLDTDTERSTPLNDTGLGSHKIVFQFLILNTIAFALLGVAWFTGHLTHVFAADQTRLCVLIFVVFIGGLMICAYKTIRTSLDQKSVNLGDPAKDTLTSHYLAQIQAGDATGRQLAASTLRMRVSQRISVIRHIANALVLLGLIGTVIGFIIALSGVDPKVASDVNAIAPMVSTLIAGMSTALYTTLVGAVLNVWLVANHQLLVSGSVNLVTSLIQRGESYARF